MNFAYDLRLLMNGSINVNGEILFDSKLVRETLDITSSCIYKNKAKKESSYIHNNRHYITLRNLCGCLSSCDKIVAKQFFGYIQHCLNRDFSSTNEVQDSNFTPNYELPTQQYPLRPLIAATNYLPNFDGAVTIKNKIVIDGNGCLNLELAGCCCIQCNGTYITNNNSFTHHRVNFKELTRQYRSQLVEQRILLHKKIAEYGKYDLLEILSYYFDHNRQELDKLLLSLCSLGSADMKQYIKNNLGGIKSNKVANHLVVLATDDARLSDLHYNSMIKLCNIEYVFPCLSELQNERSIITQKGRQSLGFTITNIDNNEHSVNVMSFDARLLFTALLAIEYKSSNSIPPVAITKFNLDYTTKAGGVTLASVTPSYSWNSYCNQSSKSVIPCAIWNSKQTLAKKALSKFFKEVYALLDDSIIIGEQNCTIYMFGSMDLDACNDLFQILSNGGCCSICNCLIKHMRDWLRRFETRTLTIEGVELVNGVCNMHLCKAITRCILKLVALSLFTPQMHRSMEEKISKVISRPFSFKKDSNVANPTLSEELEEQSWINFGYIHVPSIDGKDSLKITWNLPFICEDLISYSEDNTLISILYAHQVIMYICNAPSDVIVRLKLSRLQSFLNWFGNMINRRFPDDCCISFYLHIVIQHLVYLLLLFRSLNVISTQGNEQLNMTLERMKETKTLQNASNAVEQIANIFIRKLYIATNYSDCNYQIPRERDSRKVKEKNQDSHNENLACTAFESLKKMHPYLENLGFRKTVSNKSISEMDMSDLLTTLTLEDLRRICRDNNIPQKGRKHNLVFKVYSHYHPEEERERTTAKHRTEMEEALKQLPQSQQKNVIEMHKKYIKVYNHFQFQIQLDVDLPLHFIRSWEHYVPITGAYHGEIGNQDNLYTSEIEIGPYRIKLYAQSMYLDESNGDLFLSSCGCTWEIAWHSDSKYTISVDNKNKFLSAKDNNRGLCLREIRSNEIPEYSLWRFIPSYVFTKNEKGNGNLTYQIVNIGCNLELKELDKSVVLDEVNCNQRKNIEFKRWIFASFKRGREHSQPLDESSVSLSKRRKRELELLSSMDSNNGDEYYDNSGDFGIIAKKQSAIKDFMNTQH